jgi:hypothetical protein
MLTTRRSATGALLGVISAVATWLTGVPQAPQNFSPGSIGLLQLEHTWGAS